MPSPSLSQRLILARLAAAAMLLGTWLVPAQAITFDLHYEDGAPPADDPSGAKLSLIMDHVAMYYSRIIRDPFVLTIHYKWESKDMDNLGVHYQDGTDGLRETGAKIEFNKNQPWYYDSNPADSSEYAMSSHIYNDLAADKKLAWFNGLPPATLEVGATGGALTAPTGSYDLFTIALHEVGHALGLTSDVAMRFFPAGQALDGDYDFIPSQVGGATAAVISLEQDGPHLPVEDALMFPNTGKGVRVLPSATDILAMGAASNWTDISLVRKDFISGTSWHAAGNWVGGRVPDINDDVYIRSPIPQTVVVLTADADANALTLAGGDTLATGAHRLWSYATVNLVDASSLRVDSGGQLSSLEVHVAPNTFLEMAGGTANVRYLFLTGAGSVLSGHGTVSVEDQLDNKGTIRPDGGTLVLDTIWPSNPVWNLRGSLSSGTIDASYGDLVVNGRLVEDRLGPMVITVKSGHTVTLDSPVAWKMDATLNLQGTTAEAVLAGSACHLTGNVHVEGTGRIDAPVLANHETHVTLASGQSLILSGQTTYDGINTSTFQGSGVLVQRGDATVKGSSVIGVGTYDWDGDLGNSKTLILPGAAFFISSQHITPQPPGGSASEMYEGTVTVDGGFLEVDIDGWWMNGTMNLQNEYGHPAIVQEKQAGANSMIVSGQINVSGGSYVTPLKAQIGCPVEFVATAKVNLMTAGDNLELLGPVKYRGGMLFGPGTLVQTGSAEVSADTFIDVGAFNWAGDTNHPPSTTVNAAKTLSLYAGTIDHALGPVFLDGGTLDAHLTGPDDPLYPRNWVLSGDLNMKQVADCIPVLSGSRVALKNVSVTGKASISATALLGTDSKVSLPAATDELKLGDVEFGGGSYTGLGMLQQAGNVDVWNVTAIDTAVYDWDGPAETSATTIHPGALFTLNSAKLDVADSAYAGLITINAGILEVNTPGGWRLEPAGQVKFYGGGVIRGAPLTNEGTIGGYGRIATQTIDNKGSLEAFGGDLVIHTTARPLLDGSSGAGVLRATEGNIHVETDIGNYPFRGTAYVGDGYELRIDAGEFQNRGLLVMTGGTLAAPRFRQMALMQVSDFMATVDAQSTFAAGSTTELMADLRILGSAKIERGAVITGGRLLIEKDALLEGHGTVFSILHNAGKVRLAAGGSGPQPPAELRVLGEAPTDALLDGPVVDESPLVVFTYEQEPDGILEVDLDAAAAQLGMAMLVIPERASLDGTLLVHFDPEYVPELGQEFMVLQGASFGGPGFSQVLVENGGGRTVDLSWREEGLTLVVSPEPATLGLMFLGGAALLGRRKARLQFR